jgi:hypothetical protein
VPGWLIQLDQPVRFGAVLRTSLQHDPNLLGLPKNPFQSLVAFFTNIRTTNSRSDATHHDRSKATRSHQAITLTCPTAFSKQLKPLDDVDRPQVEFREQVISCRPVL